MTHDLDEINSALRLGDQFVPPVGSVLAWYDGTDRWIVDDSFFEEGEYRLILSSEPNEDYPHSSYGELIIPADYFPLVVYIPPEAPPFSEWERP